MIVHNGPNEVPVSFSIWWDEWIQCVDPFERLLLGSCNV
jgi:hypothetical protein